MIGKAITEIVESDLLGLIEARAGESSTLEFKRELPGTEDHGKVKFLRSVTAFANTAGGDLIYGMAATDGVASHLCPLDIPSVDQTLQRFENLCSNGVEPRLRTVHYQFVELTQGGSVLVIRVTRSWNAPHRVTVGNHSQFYGRNAAGAFPMSVPDLRRAFTLSTDITQRIRDFRAERVFALASGQGPIPLAEGAVCLLHVVPLQAFTSDVLYDVTSHAEHLRLFRSLDDGSSGFRLNLEGRLALGHQPRNSQPFGYCQLYRSGIVEAVMVLKASYYGRIIPSRHYEALIGSCLKSYLQGFTLLGIEAPAFVFLSLLGIRGYSMSLPTGAIHSGDERLADRDHMNFPEVTVTDWNADPYTLMRPVFDTVWNAFGHQRSLNYDEQGNWRSKV